MDYSFIFALLCSLSFINFKNTINIAYFSSNQSLDLVQILDIALILISIWLLQTKGKRQKYLHKLWRDKMLKNVNNKKIRTYISAFSSYVLGVRRSSY